MQIRAATAEDFLAISTLDRLAWQDNKFGEFIPDGEHVWRMWVEFAYCYCAIVEDQIVGVILAFPCHQNTRLHNRIRFDTNIESLFCVHKVMVARDRRGSGIASQLFNSLLGVLDAISATSFLTVDPDNLPAKLLYQKWGYIEQHRIDGFYRHYEDRCILVRCPSQ